MPGSGISQSFTKVFSTLATHLVAGQYGQILDFIAASVAAVGAIVADERAVAEEEKISVRIEKGAAAVASKAVDVPSISRCSER